MLEAVCKGLTLDADTMEGVAETALATFHDEARDLLVLAWDSGSSHLCELEGVIIFRSSDYSPNGPFDSLDEALVACETFSTVTTDAELDSDTVPLEKLLRIAHDIVPWDENGTIRINGQQYVADNGVLRPVEED